MYVLADCSSFAAVTPAIRQKCYDAFKEVYGSDAFEILENYRNMQITTEGQHQTSGQRNKDFRKCQTKLIEFVSASIIHYHSLILSLNFFVQLNNMQTLYGFAGVGALIGHVVNSDSGLAMVHETSDAAGVRSQVQTLS